LSEEVAISPTPDESKVVVGVAPPVVTLCGPPVKYQIRKIIQNIPNPFQNVDIILSINYIMKILYKNKTPIL
jgi:cellobiose-specific phosphotransferase system component IIB